MRWIFLFVILLLPLAAVSGSEEDVEETIEVEIKPFNKCSRNYYFDIYQARCLACTPCETEEFVVQDCGVFDNRVCSNCGSKVYAHTWSYIIKCILQNEEAYEILDGMKGEVDREAPYKIVENEHLSASDETDTEEIEDKKDDLVADTVEYTSEDDTEVDAESSEEFGINDAEIIEHNVIPQIDELVEFDDSDTDDSDEDSDEKDMISIQKAPTTDEFKYLNYLRLIRIYLFIGSAVFVSVLLSAFYCCHLSRTRRNFAIIEPPTTTPEDHHVLVRSLEFVKNKHRGFFKYEPLEEFV